MIWEATMSDVIQHLRSIGIRAPDEMLTALISDCLARKRAIPSFCEQLASLERRERELAGLARRTQAARLGSCTTLDQFDWNHPRKLDRELFEHVLSLEPIRQGHNVLLRGPAGVGKTTLAKNLGFAALQAGMSVLFCTLSEAIADLLRQPSLPATERRLRRYSSPSLLIVDELGYVPTDSHSADLLFQIITLRHETRSVVITTNLSYKLWAQTFPGASCLGALIDRFAQHCHVIDIEADSYRQKIALSRPTRPKPKR